MTCIGLANRRACTIAGLLSLALLTGCERVHLVQDPPGIPPAFADSPGNDWNAGRVQSIAISPASNRRALVAMEFGGLWGTNNGGDNWFRIFSLPAVMVSDVEFGDDGNTVVATVFRDNQVVNGAGIYVSHDRGGSWTRPASGVVPPLGSFTRTSAYGISRAPDETRLWYVGTDFGVAISTDNGDSWTHKALEPTFSPMVHRQTLRAHAAMRFLLWGAATSRGSHATGSGRIQLLRPLNPFASEDGRRNVVLDVRRMLRD